MKERDREAETLFIARGAELLRRAANGVPSCGAFLSYAEQTELEALARSVGEADRLLLWGGYEEAERKKAFFLPDRLLPVSELGEPCSVSEIYFGDPICAIELNLGIERDACGDIRTNGGSAAYIVCDRSVGDLIIRALERVGRDTVKAREISFRELETLIPKREFEAMSDTVPTPRLDAVVGSLCRMAREKAKITVQSGAVQCGGRTVQKPDSTVCDGDIISVRGHGKFRVLSISEQNKKGRYRLLAEKYK